jgi:hypothetical protein
MCFDEDMDTDVHSNSWRYQSVHTKIRYYTARFHHLTKPATAEAAFTWLPLANEWALGYANEERAGIRITNSRSIQSGSESTCSSECRGDCAAAELLVSSWDDLAGAQPTSDPPPPPPPSLPPSPPPPFVPAPPYIPGSGENDLRSWHPKDDDTPVDADGNGEFDLTCTVDSCGSPLPVFSGSAAAVHALAGELRAAGSFDGTICPYECMPTLVSHELSVSETQTFVTGAGFCGLQFNGFSDIRTVSVAGGVTMEPSYVQINTNRTGCATLAADLALLGAHMVIWHARRENMHSDDSRLGQCVAYRATRSRQQNRLWRAFSLNAQRTTNLPHYEVPEENAHCVRVPSESTLCGSTSENCIYWYEFDASSYSCVPRNDLSNVITPVVLMRKVFTSRVGNPPPSPPPPLPPAEASPPPPPAFCSAKHIPTVADGTTVTDKYGVPYAVDFLYHSHLVKCWTWSTVGEDIVWPPRHSFNDRHTYDATCNGPRNKVDMSIFRTWNRNSHDLSNEVRTPTGPPFAECSAASDDECCYAHHQFLTCKDETICPYPQPYTNRWATGCAARCNAEYRSGDDDACVPAFDRVTNRTIGLVLGPVLVS